MADHKVRDDEYFKTAKIHYIIDGKKYHVPMGYQWWMHIKYNQWPTPKAEYTETTSFEAFALLPDFRPYSNETAAQFDNKKGPGDVVSVMVKSISNRIQPIEELLKEWDQFDRLVKLPSNPDIPGFDHYVEKLAEGAIEKYWRDVYIPRGDGKAEFWLRCNRATPSTSCQLYDYRGGSTPYVEASFSSKYLQQSMDIRDGVTSLINKFVVDSSESK